MSRTILAAIGLIALAACGGGDKQATPRRPKAPAQRVASKSKSVTRSSQKAKGPQKKKAARPDTTTKRNPLTN